MSASTATRSGGTSRRMMTGITTFPMVMDAPITTIPASMNPKSGTERITVPRSTPDSETRSAISAPVRRTKIAASGVRSANISTGAVVRRPAVAPVMREVLMATAFQDDRSRRDPVRHNGQR